MSNQIIVQKEKTKFELIQDQINHLMQEQMLEMRKSQIQTEQKLETYIEKTEQVREMELKRHRVEEHRYGFVSLSDLGQMFTVSIGSKTTGKLLRLAGLANKKQSKTEPYRKFIVNGFAKSEMYGDFANYKWNPEKCISKIEDWLNESKYLEKFYSIDDENELMEYIKELELIHTND